LNPIIFAVKSWTILFEEHVLCHLVYTCVAQQSDVRRIGVKFYGLDPCLLMLQGTRFEVVGCKDILLQRVLKRCI